MKGGVTIVASNKSKHIKAGKTYVVSAETAKILTEKGYVEEKKAKQIKEK